MNRSYFIAFIMFSISANLYSMQISIPQKLEELNNEEENYFDLEENYKRNCVCFPLKKYGTAFALWLFGRRSMLSASQGKSAGEEMQAAMSMLDQAISRKSQHEQFQHKRPSKKFEDIVGGAPIMIRNITSSIGRSPGALHIEKILLYGPSGTGKSSLAEAIAGELEWDFYHIYSCSLVDKWQGSGNKNIVALFNSVKKSNPGAVVFIDEIDGIANEKSAEGQTEISRTVIALHQELDRLNTNVICIVATNFLDKLPITVKSRFSSNIIQVDLPNKDKRIAILQKILNGYDLEQNDIVNLGKKCIGYSCRDFYNMLNNAKSMIPELFEKKEIPLSLLEKKKFKDILTVAAYMVQCHKLPGLKEIKVILRYWLSTVMNSLTDDQLDQLVDVNLLKCMGHLNGLSGNEIMESVLLAYGLKNGTGFTSSDLLAGIYYNNTKKIPDLYTREELVDYFFKHEGRVFDGGIIHDIAVELEDNFSAKDIELLISKAIELEGSARLPNETGPLAIAEIYWAISECLEEKAKPFKITEQSSRNQQYMSKKTVNDGGDSVGFNFGLVSYSTSLGKGESLNIPEYYISEFPGFRIERIPLKDKEEFAAELTSGTIDGMGVRFEMCNLKAISAACACHLLDYILIFENMKLNESWNNIFSSIYLMQVIFNGKISVTTFKEIILSTINFARRVGRDICTESDLLKALKSLSFNIAGYQNIKLNESDEQSKFYRGFIMLRKPVSQIIKTPVNETKCVVS